MKLLSTLLLAGAALPAAAQVPGLVSNGATVTVAAGTLLYVGGSVQNLAGSTLANAGTVQLTGDLTNAGTLTSTGTLLFAGAAGQTLAPGGATVAQLTLNNSGSTGQNVLSVTNDLTVGTQLTLTSGLVRTAPAATITLPDGAALVGEAAGRYVQGNLRAVRTGVSGSAAVIFPNSATLNPGGQNLGIVTITRTAGLQTAGQSYGQNPGGPGQGIDRVWAVAATGATPSDAAPVTLALSWVADDDNGFVPGTTAQLWRAASAAGPWATQGAPGSAATRSFAASITQLGTFTVSNTSQPLPVVLTSFTAEARATDALLRWSTASELHNDYFEVEASADGTTFQRVGRVAGHGTSAQAHSYQFVDPAIARYAASPVYYRLRQVDLGGTASYSPVRAVQVAAAFAAIAWPLPFGAAGPSLTLRTAAAGPVALRVYDATGRCVLARTASLPAGTSTLPVPELGPLTAGLYVLHLAQGTQQTQLKLLRE
jgi:hypothetical protein